MYDSVVAKVGGLIYLVSGFQGLLVFMNTGSFYYFLYINILFDRQVFEG
jgi:hypothetical protein